MTIPANPVELIISPLLNITGDTISFRHRMIKNLFTQLWGVIPVAMRRMVKRFPECWNRVENALLREHTTALIECLHLMATDSMFDSVNWVIQLSLKSNSLDKR